MSIPSSRVTGVPEVLIDHESCTACGACVEVCMGYPLYIEKGVLQVDQTRGFGCIACGACSAVCPVDAIRISGRDLFPMDIHPIPLAKSRANYDQLNALFAARRSTRVFNTREVETGFVQKVLNAAATAPMGIPPSEVGVLVFQSRRAVQELRQLLLAEAKKWQWMFSPAMLALMHPFLGKENAAMFKTFIAPAFEMYAEKDSQGLDWFFYDAPLAVYFYGNPYNDPADALIPATLAMMAGESLGLGTCMLGFPGFIFQYSAKLRTRYNLPKKIQPGVMVIFGYPKYKNHNAITRRFREVKTYT